ncbi:MAG: hypothetical protein MH137_05215 [Flavobacteriales bacterium]|nr:hypothetical protein [Flavobacteriales bacterium]
MDINLTIPKNIENAYGKEFSWLRAEGLRHIENLSGNLWTDYNTHDPGITFLELLCYAITDLGYRTEMPIEDILASPKNNLEAMHRQFHSALEILPNSPVTVNDFRKLLVRVEGVNNVWLVKKKKHIIATYSPQPVNMRYAAEATEAIENKEKKFALKGLYDILIEFDESTFDGNSDINAWKNNVIKNVKSVYQRFRSLCEDVEDVKQVPIQEVVLCADISLTPDADPEQVWADIAFVVNEYLSPNIRYYTLKEMLAKNIPSEQIFDGPVFDLKALKADDLLDDIFFKKGFVDNDDINNSQLRDNIRLSDIIRVISKVNGVLFIKNIAFEFCSCNETDKNKVAQLFNKDKWVLCVDEGHKPVLCMGNTVLNFYKDIIPIQLKLDEAEVKLNKLNEAYRIETSSKYMEDLPMPEGKYRNLESYNSMQNQLPEIYGVGQMGLSETASMERKTQAKQLKSFLYFFDQILANYFAQLANVKNLLSADNELKRTYFSNVVSGLINSEELIADGKISSEKVIDKLNLDNFPERSNKMLNHLLARFNERFGDYVFLLHRLYGNDFNYAVIRHKKNFHADYSNVSSWRGAAYDYHNNKNAENARVNISGMEKRISRLLGFNHYKTQRLAGLPYSIKKSDTHPRSLYTWAIQKAADEILIGSGTTHDADLAYEELGLASILGIEEKSYNIVINTDFNKASFAIMDADKNIIAHTKYNSAISVDADAFFPSDDLLEALCNNTESKIRYRLSSDKKRASFYVVDNDENIIADSRSWYALLSGELESGVYSLAKNAADKTINATKHQFRYLVDEDSQTYTLFLPGNNDEILITSTQRFILNIDIFLSNTQWQSVFTEIHNTRQYLENNFRLEGMYVVEQILLRPGRNDAANNEFMPICIDVNGEYCKPLDPYSFRIAVILPGYSLRLRNRYFRQFAERIIRMETPAHVLPRICFVDEKHMLEFEEAYEDWQNKKRHSSKNNLPMDKAANKKLIDILEHLYTVYEQGYLADCDDDTPDRSPVILGSTFLGTLNNNLNS